MLNILLIDDSSDYRALLKRLITKDYPDIIKPIYQKENQFSKGIQVSEKFQYPRTKGKYTAICEGDDYWIDPL